MAVGGLVVDRRAALQDVLQLRGVEDLVLRARRARLLRPASARRGRRRRPCAPARRAPRHRAAAVLPSIFSACANSFSIAAGIERMEHQHARARQQRGVELERRIFGGGADQHHGAVFHHRQKRILLRAVEAMHLVDEQQRALARSRAARARRRTPSSGRRRRKTPRKSARNAARWHRASSRATVVLPVPGGPQKISEPSVRVASIRVSAPSGPRM